MFPKLACVLLLLACTPALCVLKCPAGSAPQCRRPAIVDFFPPAFYCFDNGQTVLSCAGCSQCGSPDKLFDADTASVWKPIPDTEAFKSNDFSITVDMGASVQVETMQWLTYGDGTHDRANIVVYTSDFAGGPFVERNSFASPVGGGGRWVEATLSHVPAARLWKILPANGVYYPILAEIAFVFSEDKIACDGLNSTFARCEPCEPGTFSADGLGCVACTNAIPGDDKAFFHEFNVTGAPCPFECANPWYGERCENRCLSGSLLNSQECRTSAVPVLPGVTLPTGAGEAGGSIRNCPAGMEPTDGFPPEYLMNGASFTAAGDQIELYGEDHYIDLGPLQMGGVLLVETRIRLSPLSVSAHRSSIIAHFSDEANENEFTVGLWGLSARLYLASNAGAFITATQPLPLNEFVVISAFIRGNMDSKIFVNGVVVASGRLPFFTSSSMHMTHSYFGRGRVPGASHMKGSIDWFRVYPEIIQDSTFGDPDVENKPVGRLPGFPMTYCAPCKSETFKEIGDGRSCAICGGCGEGFFVAGCQGTFAGNCTACEPCSPGTFRVGCSGSNAGTCTACEACSPGTFRVGCSGSSAGTCSACEACSPGKFRAGCSGLSAGDCQTCSEGKYQPDTNAAAECMDCAPCGLGEFRSGCGDAVSGSCTPWSGCGNCSAGFETISACIGSQAVNDTAVNVSCVECSSGKFKAEQGRQLCEDCGQCSLGQYRVGCSGSSLGECVKCEDCPAGYWRAGCGGESAGTCEQISSAIVFPVTVYPEDPGWCPAGRDILPGFPEEVLRAGTGVTISEGVEMVEIGPETGGLDLGRVMLGGELSIEIWMKLRTAPSAGASFVEFPDAQFDCPGRASYWDRDPWCLNEIYLRAGWGGELELGCSGVVVTAALPLPVQQWIHVVAVIASQARLYIDGVEAAPPLQVSVQPFVLRGPSLVGRALDDSWVENDMCILYPYYGYCFSRQAAALVWPEFFESWQDPYYWKDVLGMDGIVANFRVYGRAVGPAEVAAHHSGVFNNSDSLLIQLPAEHCGQCKPGTVKTVAGSHACSPCAGCDAGFFRDGCAGSSPGTCFPFFFPRVSPTPCSPGTSSHTGFPQQLLVNGLSDRGVGLELDGLDDFLDLGSMTLPRDLTIVIEAHCEFGGSGSTSMTLFEFSDGGSDMPAADRRLIRLGIEQGMIVVTTSHGEFSWSPPDVLEAGELGFVRVALTLGLDGEKLYLDGNEIASSSTVHPYGAFLRRYNYIGKGYEDLDGDFKGTISKVLVYGRTLSAVELTADAADDSLLVRLPMAYCKGACKSGSYRNTDGICMQCSGCPSGKFMRGCGGTEAGTCTVLSEDEGEDQIYNSEPLLWVKASRSDLQLRSEENENFADLVNLSYAPYLQNGLVLRDPEGRNFKYDRVTNTIRLNQGEPLRFDLVPARRDSTRQYDGTEYVALKQTGEERYMRHSHSSFVYHFSWAGFVADLTDWAGYVADTTHRDLAHIYSWRFIDMGDGTFKLLNDLGEGWYLGYDEETDSVRVVNSGEEKAMWFTIDSASKGTNFVERWFDRSGNHNDFLQVDPSSQPEYEHDALGKGENAVRFSPVSNAQGPKFLGIDDFQGPDDELTIIAKIQPASPHGTVMSQGFNIGGDQHGWAMHRGRSGWCSSGPNALNWGSYNGTNSGQNQGFVPGASSSCVSSGWAASPCGSSPSYIAHVIGIRKLGKKVNLYVNNKLVWDEDLDTADITYFSTFTESSTPPLLLGKGADPTGFLAQHFAGHISELVMWNRRLGILEFETLTKIVQGKCYNGINDLHEEGVDCGGSCGPCRQEDNAQELQPIPVKLVDSYPSSGAAALDRSTSSWILSQEESSLTVELLEARSLRSIGITYRHEPFQIINRNSPRSPLLGVEIWVAPSPKELNDPTSGSARKFGPYAMPESETVNTYFIELPFLTHDDSFLCGSALDGNVYWKLVFRGRGETYTEQEIYDSGNVYCDFYNGCSYIISENYLKPVDQLWNLEVLKISFWSSSTTLAGGRQGSEIVSVSPQSFVCRASASDLVVSSCDDCSGVCEDASRVVDGSDVPWSPSISGREISIDFDLSMPTTVSAIGLRFVGLGTYSSGASGEVFVSALGVVWVPIQQFLLSESAGSGSDSAAGIVLNEPITSRFWRIQIDAVSGRPSPVWQRIFFYKPHEDNAVEVVDYYPFSFACFYPEDPDKGWRVLSCDQRVTYDNVVQMDGCPSGCQAPGSVLLPKSDTQGEFAGFGWVPTVGSGPEFGRFQGGVWPQTFDLTFRFREGADEEIAALVVETLGFHPAGGKLTVLSADSMLDLDVSATEAVFALNTSQTHHLLMMPPYQQRVRFLKLKFDFSANRYQELGGWQAIYIRTSIQRVKFLRRSDLPPAATVMSYAPLNFYCLEPDGTEREVSCCDACFGQCTDPSQVLDAGAIPWKPALQRHASLTLKLPAPTKVFGITWLLTANLLSDPVSVKVFASQSQTNWTQIGQYTFLRGYLQRQGWWDNDARQFQTMPGLQRMMLDKGTTAQYWRFEVSSTVLDAQISEIDFQVVPGSDLQMENCPCLLLSESGELYQKQECDYESTVCGRLVDVSRHFLLPSDNYLGYYAQGYYQRPVLADCEYDGPSCGYFLDLSRQGITSIHPRAFLGLDQIKILNLKDNQLTVFDPNGFQPLKDLEILQLGNNFITDMIAAQGETLTALRDLDLEGNLLSHLHIDSFVGMESLQRIILVLNDFRCVPILQNVQDLVWLERYVVNGGLDLCLPQQCLRSAALSFKDPFAARFAAYGISRLFGVVRTDLLRDLDQYHISLSMYVSGPKGQRCWCFPEGVICFDVNQRLQKSATETCAAGEREVAVTCPAGYSRNGFGVCEDVDECASDAQNTCHVKAACWNTKGSFTCLCHAGYEGDGVTCVDIDECLTGDDDCDVKATCTNWPGDYTCTCNVGFYGNGTTCDDVDECESAEANNCHVNATCTDTQGSYTCQCNAGSFSTWLEVEGTACSDCPMGTFSGAGAESCNAPPEITSIEINNHMFDSGEVGNQLVLDISFSDQDFPADYADSEAHTALLDWNCDGTLDQNESVPAGQSTLTLRYDIPAPPTTWSGVFPICLVVSDSRGLSDAENANGYVVMYTSENAMTQGAGWFYSTPNFFDLSKHTGQDPSTVSEVKAFFGFLTQLDKGALTCRFQFDLRDTSGKDSGRRQDLRGGKQTSSGGNEKNPSKTNNLLSFSGDSVEWLVIPTTKLAKFSGEGTIAGAATQYKFLVTIYDAPDSKDERLRVKIWDEASRDIVYDNQPGQDDTGYLATPINGGSLQIKAPVGTPSHLDAAIGREATSDKATGAAGDSSGTTLSAALITVGAAAVVLLGAAVALRARKARMEVTVCNPIAIHYIGSTSATLVCSSPLSRAGDSDLMLLSRGGSSRALLSRAEFEMVDEHNPPEIQAEAQGSSSPLQPSVSSSQLHFAVA